MFRSIFNAENGLFKPFGWFVDVVTLSLMWLVSSLVILPFGGATAALYDAAARGIRAGELAPWSRFVRSLKENFVPGILAGVIVLAACYGLYRLHGVVYGLADTGDRRWGMVYVAFWVMLALANGLLTWVLPLLSRFEFKLGGLLSTALALGMTHPFSTLALGIFTTGCLVVGGMLLWTLFFLPCLWALGASLLLERAFRPYVEAQSGGSASQETET